MSQLFTPITIGSLELANRIIIAPMCQYSAEQGKTTDWHLQHFSQMALSGAGLFIIEATAVEPAGRISAHDIGLWDDQTEHALHDTVRRVKQLSPMPLAIQLAHAGRKASCSTPWQGGHQLTLEQGGWQTFAPSAIAYSSQQRTPHALSQAEITQIINAFVASAQRADRIGFDAIEIHAAHGYLLHQFLSPLANFRDDHYGGSLENRMRLTLDVFQAIRQALPKQTIGVRISATDWVDGGWDLAQSEILCQQLKMAGCDFIDISTGGLSEQQKVKPEPNYQVSFAEGIKASTGLPTMAVGLITQPAQAEAIIRNQQADMVALARGILFNPHWPWQAAVELGGKVHAPKPYLRAIPQGVSDLFW